MAPLPTGRLPLGSWLVLSAGLGIVVALARAFGPHGFGLGLFIYASLWCAISFTTSTWFHPLNTRPWTSAQALTVFAVCGWVYVMVIPAPPQAPYVPPVTRLVHEASGTLPDLPTIDVVSPERFVNDLMLSPYWKVERTHDGSLKARARSVGVDWPDDGENAFLFELMANPHLTLPDEFRIFNHGLRGRDALNTLGVSVVFEKPDSARVTFGESTEDVAIKVYESYQDAIGPNSHSGLAIKLSSQHEIYMVLSETGRDPARTATFAKVAPAMRELAGLAASPDEYRVEDRYAEFFTLFFDPPFTDDAIKRFPGLQGRDTFYGYLRTNPATSYAGVNIKIAHPVYCPDEGTSKVYRLRNAEYLGKPYEDGDLVFFLIEDNAVYLSGLYDWWFGYFSGGGNTFEGTIEVLNDQEAVLLTSKGRFTSWQR